MFRVVGFSRRPLSDNEWRKHLEEKMKPRLKTNSEKFRARKFLKYFSYHQGFIDKKGDYASLSKTLAGIDKSWGMCANKLFYLAVPPELYETILICLAHSGLTAECLPKEGPVPLEASSASSLMGWTRVIVEKPFGKNLKTAQELDALMGKLFKEKQIYRIDHYLAKEMLQNILIFRFANNLFERNWDNTSIEKIEIRLLEKIGVENRGAFYDSVGALRDVGQNHLLQMLALATMERPKTFEPETIRSRRVELLKKLKTPSRKEIELETFRAQYEGYKNIKGVNKKSRTETYFKVSARLESERWQGVEITLESGKRLGEPVKDITIHFRHPAVCACPRPGPHHQNKILIRLEPKEEIDVSFWSKKPGFETNTEERKLNFLFREKTGMHQYTEEYEKLLLDCIAGNQTLFISTNEIAEMWRFTDPIVNAWDKNLVPMKAYKPNTNEITREAEKQLAIRRPAEIKKNIGIIGLGKMGSNIARSLLEKEWRVVGFNRSPEKTAELAREGLEDAYSFGELVSKLAKPRVIWTMLPAGEATEKTLFGKNGLAPLLEKGDIVIDAGNSFYKDSIRREKLLKNRGIKFLDAGVSGGPAGARNGAAIMVGGEKKTNEFVEKLFRDLSIPGGYGRMGSVGAGHFVKMIHNGIEYGMMQAIGEGFEVLHAADLRGFTPLDQKISNGASADKRGKIKFKFNLKDVAQVYSRGTVIESRLISWLGNALDVHGPDLKEVSGTVHHTGEGAWTVKTAVEEKVKIKIIEEALKFRIASEKNPTYTGKVVSALREQFGGHSVEEKKK